MVIQQRNYATVTIVERFFPKSFRLKSHVHSLPWLGVALSGRYTERIRGRADECQPGVIRYLPAGEPHTPQLDGPGRALLFQINPALLECLTEYTGYKPMVGALDGNAWPLTQSLVSEYRHNDDATPLAIECLVLQVLIHMNRTLKPPPANVAPALLRAREMVHEHKGGRLALRKIAQEVGAHPVYLSIEFRRVFNRSMSEYLRDVMLDRARAFLADSDLPLSEISEVCGFHDQSHFSRAFKKANGLTPLAYRKHARSQRLFFIPCPTDKKGCAAV